MDDTATTTITIKTKPNDNKSRKRRWSEGDDEQSKCEDDNDLEEEKQCDVELWETLSRSFRQVQSVLDQNRALIQQANDNHRSRVPDNLSKNVVLIRNINSNINKVLSIYSDLSANFSSIVHRPRAIIPAKSNKNDGDEDNDTGNWKLDRVKSGVESQ